MENNWHVSGGRETEQREGKERARTCRREILVVNRNVRTVAVDGTHVIGRGYYLIRVDVLSGYDGLRCDTISNSRRPDGLGLSASRQTGFLIIVYCNGECGDENGERKKQPGK